MTSRIAMGLYFICVPTIVAAANYGDQVPFYRPLPAPTFSWSGSYIGVNAGYAFDAIQTNSLSANDFIAQFGLDNGYVAPSVANRIQGFTGGAQVGYNYELGNLRAGRSRGGFLIGGELDAAYAGLQATHGSIGTGGDDTSFHSRIDYLGTVRARLGYAFDQLLLYGTGGFAYGGIENDTSLVVPPNRTTFYGAKSTLQTGYAYGGGIEYAFTKSLLPNILTSGALTVKAEFLHYDLGTSSSTMATLTAPTFSYNNHIHTDGNLVRVGLNYKFDWTPNEVIRARY